MWIEYFKNLVFTHDYMGIITLITACILMLYFVYLFIIKGIIEASKEILKMMNKRKRTTNNENLNLDSNKLAMIFNFIKNNKRPKNNENLNLQSNESAMIFNFIKNNKTKEIND